MSNDFNPTTDNTTDEIVIPARTVEGYDYPTPHKHDPNEDTAMIAVKACAEAVTRLTEAHFDTTIADITIRGDEYAHTFEDGIVSDCVHVTGGDYTGMPVVEFDIYYLDETKTFHPIHD